MSMNMSMSMNMKDEITLVSHELCPYVQRAAIAMAEKNQDFNRIYIALDNPPAWFGQVSPLGRVPLLLVGEKAIFESAVILEYLEETTGPALHPGDPLERARHRGWMEFGSSILDDIGRFYSAGEERRMVRAVEDIRAKFVRLEQELADGPWFAGSHFSLVDCVFGPIFRYFDVFDAIADFGFITGLSRVQSWRQHLARRASVVSAVRDEYPERLHQFLRDRNSHLSTLMRMEEPRAGSV